MEKKGEKDKEKQKENGMEKDINVYSLKCTVFTACLVFFDKI